MSKSNLPKPRFLLRENTRQCRVITACLTADCVNNGGSLQAALMTQK
jgi:hypothetical protein